jgi:hypothetical protein
MSETVDAATTLRQALDELGSATAEKMTAEWDYWPYAVKREKEAAERVRDAIVRLLADAPRSESGEAVAEITHPWT